MILPVVRFMQRHSFARPIAIVLAVGLTVACHGRGAPQAEPVVAGGFGDTTALGVRVVAFNAARDQVTYELAKPAHVVALWVFPGHGLGQIESVAAPDTAPTAAGIHEMRVSAPRAPTVVGGAQLLAEDDYRRCVEDFTRTATERKLVRVVDSTGTPVADQRPEQHETALETEKRAARECAKIKNRPAASFRLADRFLVLIASNVRLTSEQVRDLVEETSVSEADLPATLTAIANAIYVDRTATWAGYYTRW